MDRNAMQAERLQERISRGREPMRLPHLCAWCGARQPATERTLRFRTAPKSSNRLELALPICTACDTYRTQAIKLHSTMMKKFVLPTLLVGLALGYPMVMLDGRVYTVFETLVMTFCLFGPIIWGVLYLLLFAVFELPLYKSILRRRIGDPPSGYEHGREATHQPCAYRYYSRTWQFHNETFHARFAEANPEWAWQPENKK